MFVKKQTTASEWRVYEWGKWE